MYASVWTRWGPRGLPSPRIFIVLGDMTTAFVRPPPRDLGKRDASIVQCGLSCLVDLNSDVYHLCGALHGLDTFWARGLRWMNKETTTTITTRRVENSPATGVKTVLRPVWDSKWLQMLVGMQIEILNGSEILVNWSKLRNSNFSVSRGTNSNWDFVWIWILLYFAVQIQIQILV